MHEKIKVINLTPKMFKELCHQLSFWDHYDIHTLSDIPNDNARYKSEIVFTTTSKESMMTELKNMGYECFHEEWVEYQEKCCFCNGTGILNKKK